MTVRLPVACNRDCGGGCPLLATVEDGRVVRIGNNPAGGPFLRGCPRGFQAARQLYAEDRLTKPLVRSGPRGSGQFREITWSEAVRTVADGLQRVREQHGDGAILALGGSGSCRGALHNTAELAPRFLNLIGGHVGESRQLQLGGCAVRAAGPARHGRARRGRSDAAARADDRPVGPEPDGLHHGLRVARPHPPGEEARRAGRRHRPAAHRDGEATGHAVAAGAAGHRQRSDAGGAARARQRRADRRAVHRRARRRLRGAASSRARAGRRRSDHAGVGRAGLRHAGRRHRRVRPGVRPPQAGGAAPRPLHPACLGRRGVGAPGDRPAGRHRQPRAPRRLVRRPELERPAGARRRRHPGPAPPGHPRASPPTTGPTPCCAAPPAATRRSTPPSTSAATTCVRAPTLPRASAPCTLWTSPCATTSS